MRVAAYQAPLLPGGTTSDAIRLIREQVQRCEAEGVEILCCPEAILGGLADYAPRPHDIAIAAEGGDRCRAALQGRFLEQLLAPLASARVTTIVGFTEVDGRGHLFNTAAVFHRGSVAGLYRKRHPAIRRSVYEPGGALPVFTIGGLTFGILICRDSTFGAPVRLMAAQGAAALFVPTNNALPPEKGGRELVAEARQCDVTRATENGVWVIRADVAGCADGLVSYGSSAIVDPAGALFASARQLEPDLLVVDLMPAAERQRGLLAPSIG
jgi:predicted amidohydrolase